MSQRLISWYLVGLALVSSVSAAHAEECTVRVGEYSGRVKAEWLTKTREMRLLEDFAFKDPECRVWAVPKGAIVDGASIPRVFWTVIGGPFDGPYRDGSVVHDYYCKVRTAPSEQVHEMFYHALLANGVDSNTAALMFYAVRWFGPRWEILKAVTLTTDYSAFAVIPSTKAFDLPSAVVQQMSETAGQPSPLDWKYTSITEFNKGADNAKNAKWLLKDGALVDRTGEIAAPGAFTKSVEKGISKQFSKSDELPFRLYSAGAATAEPSQAEVARLRTWIETAHPPLDVLKTTPPDQVH